MASQAQEASGPGWVYTVHFDRPLGTTGRNSARHYTGYAAWDVDARLEQHRHGSDAKIMHALEEAGIGFTLVDVRPGGRDDERRLKRRGHHDLRCGICHPQRQEPAAEEPEAGS